MGLDHVACRLSQKKSQTSTSKEENNMLRNIDDPMQLEPSEFRKIYRVGQDIALDLIERLEAHLKGVRVTSLSAEKQVLCALRFYAAGGYQRAVGEQWDISMSQSSISRSIHKVTDALNSITFFEEVRFPMTEIESQAAKEVFSTASAPFVEGTIGAIDTTYIAIMAPKKYEDSYIDPRGCHSLNVQMICDPYLKILNVNAKFPGAQHDSVIWSSSAARRAMEIAYENGNHMFLIGGSGYPLEPWLMTPLSNQPRGTPKFRYNEALYKARKPIFRLFSVIENTWQCLSREKVLSYDPCFAGKVVNACATLHNIRLDEEIDENEDFDLILETHTDGASDDLICVSSVAKEVQDNLITKYFC